MVLNISTASLDAIRAQARASGANECCGLLLGDNAGTQIMAILPAANVAEAPHHRFEIDPATLLSAHREARAGGPAILGHYHSHPRGDPVPSQIDAQQAEARGETWLIVGHDGTIRAWRATPSGGLHGCFDPVELAETAHHGLAPAGPQRH